MDSVTFDYTAVIGKSVNHASWLAIVTPTNHSMSVRYRYVIELIGWRFYIFTLPD